MPKEFLAYQQRMEKLRSSGLTIEDKGACCRVLADIDYFLVVNGYQSFFRDPSTRVCCEGATFGDILALYEFDVELREIMLDALLKVEAKLVKCSNGYLLSDESVGDERLELVEVVEPLLKALHVALKPRGVRNLQHVATTPWIRTSPSLRRRSARRCGLSHRPRGWTPATPCWVWGTRGSGESSARARSACRRRG